ncbi:MAG: M1 family metallopeptidase, partial [Cryomorphaceae bacterium]
MKGILLTLTAVFSLSVAFSQENTNTNKFRQLGTELPTPNVYRTASGAPGPQYWQQRADYRMEVSLDEDLHRIDGEQTVTYFNNSPDVLEYIWVQLDQNMRAKDSDTYKIRQNKLSDEMSFREFKNLTPWFDGGFKLDEVTDTRGNDLPYTVNKTMMRIDLEKPMVPNSAVSFRIKWHYNINDRMAMGGRSGYEMFEDENNALYTIAQFYPRMAVYSDDEGWNHKQFLGRGEFTLPFGNFDVKITVPADHVVAATGELQNTRDMLTAAQRGRFEQAKTSAKPVEIITEAEAVETEKGRAKATRTWHFKADNVRDFGWASSRKFIWDAQGIKFGNRTVMAMSYYPKEGNPLWGKYSTAAVIQTLKTYSNHTFDYPYPVAISVNAARMGMEYPMICFNYGRCEDDGTYTERTKYGMIGVIIHEVGHNYFPMIVNSDERNWTWMDEGLNTFLQYLTEQQWERGYPSRRGEPRKIVDYMKGDKSNISPIMTNSESVHQFGNNGYGKPAAALNILRETIMGRELFDFAFRTYANRWKFKHPTPADFFRTMEDASGVD